MRTLQLHWCQHISCSAAQPGGAQQRNQRMQSVVQRLKSSSTSEVSAKSAAVASPPAAQEAPSDESFLTPDELKMALNDEQLAFLVRKRKAALGLGPVMPLESQCPDCDGIGTIICQQCGGTGTNATNKATEMFRPEGEIKTNNGLIRVDYLFWEGGPCWLCRGRVQCGCSSCSGTGIRGGVDRFTGD